MSASLLGGLPVAEETGATTPDDTVAETSVAAISDTAGETTVTATPDTVADTSVATTRDVAEVEIVAPGEPWAGATIGEWDARAWQWDISLPEDVNPSFDATGERCGYGQFGPVFFLAGNSGPGSAEGVKRTCVVAEGTAIYLGVVGAECSTLEPPPFFGRNEEELRACANAFMDQAATDFDASVKGQAVDLDEYRFSSPLFTLTFAENNLFGVEPGVAQAVSVGYGFIIAPPPPGEYEIAWSVLNAGAPERFAITVKLIVDAPQVIEAPPTT